MSEFVWPPPRRPANSPADDFAEREPVYAIQGRGGPGSERLKKKRRTPEEILANVQRKLNERGPIEAAKKAAAKAAKNKAADEEQAKLDAAMEEAIAGRAPFPRFQTGPSKRSTALVGPPERHLTEDNIRTRLNIEKMRAERAAEEELGGAAGGAGGELSAAKLLPANFGEENENTKLLAGLENKEFLEAMAAARDPFGGAAGGQGGGRRKTKRGKKTRKMRKTRKHKTRGRK